MASNVESAASGGAVRRGRLIAVEGIDGSGKSTLAQRLVDTLNGLGEPAALVRPLAAGRPALATLRSGSRLASTTTAGIAPGLDVFTVFLTYATAGAVAESINPLLAEGTTVVCDRYLTSHLANQSVFGVDLTNLEVLIRAVPPADHVLYLRIDPTEALARILQRGGDRGVFDDLPTLHRAASAFDQHLPDTAVTLDASRPEASVLADACSAIGASS